MWPVAVELALQTGATAILDRLLGIVDADADRLKVPLSVRAHRARFAGLVTHKRDPETAEALLRTAVDGFTTWGSPHHRAQAEADLAAVLETLGRDQESAALLTRARATLVEVGAHALLARLQPVVA